MDRSDPAKHTLSPRAESILRGLLAPLDRYHQHQVEGLDNIPKTGGMIMAMSHSFATYDGFLAGEKIYRHTGRDPMGLGDNLIFETPILRDLAWSVGLRPGSHAVGHALLSQGRMLMLAPGGMRESLRPESQRFKVDWSRRLGFVKLAIRAQVPIVLCACGAADRLYTVKQSRLTSFMYERFKVPVPVVFGRRGSLIPRKIRLRSHISKPFYPPEHDPESEDTQVQAMHAKVHAEMNRLMKLD